MNNKETNIDQLINSAERIGTIGSPSSTSELALDILGTAVGKKLVGELALFKFSQDGKPHYTLGQITEIPLIKPENRLSCNSGKSKLDKEIRGNI